MKWVKLTSPNDIYFDEAWEIYEQSFPIFEQRLLADQVKAMTHLDFSFTVIVEKQKVVAIVGYWTFNEYMYIEHLAVHPSMRGRQIGSTLLKELSQQGKTMILEINPPVDDISIRRLKFYETVGFKLNSYSHVHPPYRQNYEGHELKVLSYEDPISPKIFHEFTTYLNEVVMEYAYSS